MRPEMIIGYGIAVVFIIAFVLWNFVFHKHTSKIFKTEKPDPPVFKLRSLKAEKPAPDMARELVKGVVETPEIEVAAAKYKAMVWTDEGIIFKKIPEKIGTYFTCDPSMPSKGNHLLVCEKVQNGLKTYESFDPREIPIISEETPEWAYDSTHCYKEVYAWFKNKADLWDKINTVLIGLAIAGMILVAIVAIDKLK